MSTELEKKIESSDEKNVLRGQYISKQHRGTQVVQINKAKCLRSSKAYLKDE
jgi:hypothetical protein